jgi:PDZ domain-containing protein
MLLLVTVAVLWIWPSSDYLFLPEAARPVAPLVSVEGGTDPKGPGGIYYDAIVVRRAKLFEQLFPWIHDGVTLVPADQVNPPGASDRQRRTEDLREMARSQDIAGAVALKYLGYDVTLRATGVLVSAVIAGSPAAKAGLQPTDVIVALDGTQVRTPPQLRKLMSRRKPGQTVRLTLRAGSGLKHVRVGTIADPNEPTRALIGILTDQATQVKLPVAVRIDAGSIGGPSAGLAFALDVMEELGHNVDRGYRVAATGELAADGSVIPIGGIKQKTIGARRAKVDIFLVPAGQNAKEARKYAGGVRVIAVDSFRQALQALATLPPKR